MKFGKNGALENKSKSNTEAVIEQSFWCRQTFFGKEADTLEIIRN